MGIGLGLFFLAVGAEAADTNQTSLLPPSASTNAAPGASLLGPDPSASSGGSLLAPAGGAGLLAGPDLLSGPPPPLSRSLHSVTPQHQATMAEEAQANAAHAKLFQETRYPSAALCKDCHPLQYREWSVSPHAYAQMSPAFNSMQAKINKGNSGSQGDFCIRCHTGVGMNLEESTFTPNMNRHATSLEGVTCIVCHRVNRNFGRASGRMGIVEGDLYQPIYGPHDAAEFKRVLSDSETYHLATSSNQFGRAVHGEVVQFFEMAEPRLCGMCHDVNLTNFRLEAAYSEYKNSPAQKRGATCQDCHMGTVQGVVSGFAQAPSALLGTIPTKVRKHVNHMMPGPDHSIIHPGLYPQNPDARKMATIDQWVAFDDKSGWGTDAFENKVSADFKFPARWSFPEDRYSARAIIDQNKALMKEYLEKRVEVLKNGYQLGDLVVERNDGEGIEFSVEVRNATDGHNTPTGFDAERLTFLQVTVTDRDGKVVFKSGDTDPNGDVRDLHSVYVNKGRLPLDAFLFSLQSKFIDLTAKGGEQEQILPTNFSQDPLPFVRPLTQSGLIIGHPSIVRKQKKGIEPLGNRRADYEVDADALTGKGPYQVNIKLIAGALPVNLIHTIQGVGFDYNMSPLDVARGIQGTQTVLWDRSVVLKPGTKRVDLKARTEISKTSLTAPTSGAYEKPRK